MIVHLIEYGIVPGHEAEMTGFLRHVVLAAPPADGLVSRLAGRRLSRHGREHIFATTWRDAAALAGGIDGRGVPAALAEKSGLFGGATASLFRVAASAGPGEPGRTLGARVMRVHRSFIDADAVDLWEQRTRETFGSLVAKDGLVTAVAGVELAGSDASANKGGAGIVVLTTWAEWGVLLSATGGRLERALTVTESPDPERPVRVDLYEILRVGSE